MDRMSTDLKLAIDTVKKASEVIYQGFDKIHQISEKDNKSIVTEVDKNSEKAVLSALEKDSKYPILSEETRSTISSASSYWAVDPLDGTTNFSRQIPFCAVSIALVRNNEVVLGVVFNPFTDELFYAEKGQGAFLNDKRITVSDKQELLFANTGYNLEHKEKYIQVVAATGKKYTLRKFGSSAYELATIARGSADGFICWGDELWDHAAGIILVQEAGGIVTDWKGNAWTPEEKHVLAGNKTSHMSLLAITTTL